MHHCVPPTPSFLSGLQWEKRAVSKNSSCVWWCVSDFYGSRQLDGTWGGGGEWWIKLLLYFKSKVRFISYLTWNLPGGTKNNSDNHVFPYVT